MTPPRKKQDLNEIKLIPEKEFEDVMRAVLRAPRERVAEQEAKEKAERAARSAE